MTDTKVERILWALVFWVALFALIFEPSWALWHWLVSLDLGPVQTLALFGALEFVVIFAISVIAVLGGAMLFDLVRTFRTEVTRRDA